MFLLLAALLGLLSTPRSGLAANEAAELLAKHRLFTGWSFGDGTFRSLKVSGTHGESDFVRLSRGLLFRETQTNRASQLQYDSGFTGSVFWESNQNGFTVPLLGDAAKYEVSIGYVFEEIFAGVSGVYKGSALIGATSTGIVRIAPSGAYPVDLYIDAASGALKRVVIDPAGTADAIDILRYDTVGDKRVMASWRYEGGATYDVQSIVPNAPITDDALHPPAQRARWKFAAPAPIPVRVDLGTLTEDGGVEIDAAFNGVRGKFALDTGASGIYLSGTYAQRIRAKEVAAHTSYGVSEHPVHGTVSRVDTIEIGGNTLSNVNVLTGIDFGNLDGLLGYDFLAGAIVDLDVVKKQLTIYDPAKYDANISQGVIMLADLSDGHIKIPVKINGGLEIPMALDSGDPMLALLSMKLFDDHKVDMRVEFHTQLTGIGGTSSDDPRNSAACGHLRSLNFGPIVYDNVPACFSPHMKSANSTGLVGFDFMKHFNWTFDYPHSRVVLTKNGI